MTDRVLIDAGPIVALLSRRDEHHRLCAETAALVTRPMLTCWPVITEAAWLLKSQPATVQKLINGVAKGVFELLELRAADADAIGSFLNRYQNVRAELADAAVMHLAEREDIDLVFTLDRRDFSVYRTTDGRAMRLLPAVL